MGQTSCSFEPIPIPFGVTTKINPLLDPIHDCTSNNTEGIIADSPIFSIDYTVPGRWTISYTPTNTVNVVLGVPPDIVISVSATGTAVTASKVGTNSFVVDYVFNGRIYHYNFTLEIFEGVLTLGLTISATNAPTNSSPSPSTNNPISLFIFAQVDSTIGDVSEVAYTVGTPLCYERVNKFNESCESICDTNSKDDGLGCYDGFTRKCSDVTNPLDGNLKGCDSSLQTPGYLFYVSFFEVGPTIIGKGTFVDKTTELGLSDYNDLLTYALVKGILGRLLFEEFDLKWLYRDNYCALIEKLKESVYFRFITYMIENEGLELYFRYNC